MSTPEKGPAQKLWSGRISGAATDPRVERFGASIDVDARLLPHDVAGSLAHAAGLVRAGLLSAADGEAIALALPEVERALASGEIPHSLQLEDIHTHVEVALRQRAGDAGARLHTGRSRNDQVATDVRLWLRATNAAVVAGLDAVRAALVDTAGRHVDVVMPGYTHLQRGQPVRFSHHLLAYYEMFTRDRGRFIDAGVRSDAECPLGSGALAGSTLPLERSGVAAALGFGAPSRNSLDAVSSRDALMEFTAASTICMVHLSRLAEDLVLWATEEFGFVALPDAFCTGSSLMPQKKNPDVPELIRGKVGRVLGDFVALATLCKALPLAYNRDLQEDKPPLFDAADTLLACLEVAAPLVAGLEPRPERMREALEGRGAHAGLVLATDLAEWLVEHGVPFRDAHGVVGRLVSWCLSEGRALTALTLDELRAFDVRFEASALECLRLDGAVDRRDLPGGPARRRVEEALAVARTQLSAEQRHRASASEARP